MKAAKLQYAAFAVAILSTTAGLAMSSPPTWGAVLISVGCVGWWVAGMLTALRSVTNAIRTAERSKGLPSRTDR